MSVTSEATSLREEFCKQVDAKLEALGPMVKEFEDLRSLRESLGEGTRTRTSSSPGRSPGRPRGRSNGSTRLDQLVKLVNEHPGITIANAAKELGGVQPNYLYRVREKAVEAKQLTVEDGKMFPINIDHPDPERIKELEAAGAAA